MFIFLQSSELQASVPGPWEVQLGRAGFSQASALDHDGSPNSWLMKTDGLAWDAGEAGQA